MRPIRTMRSRNEETSNYAKFICIMCILTKLNFCRLNISRTNSLGWEFSRQELSLAQAYSALGDRERVIINVMCSDAFRVADVNGKARLGFKVTVICTT